MLNTQSLIFNKLWDKFQQPQPPSNDPKSESGQLTVLNVKAQPGNLIAIGQSFQDRESTLPQNPKHQLQDKSHPGHLASYLIHQDQQPQIHQKFNPKLSLNRAAALKKKKIMSILESSNSRPSTSSSQQSRNSLV